MCICVCVVLYMCNKSTHVQTGSLSTPCTPLPKKECMCLCGGTLQNYCVGCALVLYIVNIFMFELCVFNKDVGLIDRCVAAEI